MVLETGYQRRAEIGGIGDGPDLPIAIAQEDTGYLTSPIFLKLQDDIAVTKLHHGSSRQLQEVRIASSPFERDQQGQGQQAS
jgi:hypothetical protein